MACCISISAAVVQEHGSEYGTELVKKSVQEPIQVTGQASTQKSYLAFRKKSVQEPRKKSVQKPLKVLIITGQHSHDWENTVPILSHYFESSDRFIVDVLLSPDKNEDISDFNAPFADYDVVVSHYYGALWPEAMRNDFQDYVRSGGGFVVVHAANNAFPEWDEYNRMTGLGGWGGRDETAGPYIRLRDGVFVADHDTPGRGGKHGPRHRFRIDNRRPDHPVMNGLPDSWLHAEDELYELLRGPAENLTVLATAFSGPENNGTGEHEPMIMTVTYGNGRVFHTVLGHDATAMDCVGFKTLLLRGSEWAASGKVTLPVPADFPD